MCRGSIGFPDMVGQAVTSVARIPDLLIVTDFSMSRFCVLLSLPTLIPLAWDRGQLRPIDIDSENLQCRFENGKVPIHENYLDWIAGFVINAATALNARAPKE